MVATDVQDHATEWEGHASPCLITPVYIPPWDTHHSISRLADKLTGQLTLCVVLQHLQLCHLQSMMTLT